MTEGPSSDVAPREPDWASAPVGEPPASWRPRPIAALGNIAAVLIALVALANIAFAWASQNTFEVVRDYVAGVPGVGAADLEAADAATRIAAISFYAAFVAAGIAFLVWQWRARVNCDGLSPAPRRRSRGWVIASWFVPVVSLWFPYQDVSDVWKISDPETRERPGSEIRGVRVLAWWWACWLIWWIAESYSDYALRADDLPVEAFQRSAVADAVSAAATAVAALLIIIIVRRISYWQTQPGARTLPAV